MSLVGVYPSESQMTREELIEYCYFLQAQAICKELELEKEIDDLKARLYNTKEAIGQ